MFFHFAIGYFWLLRWRILDARVVYFPFFMIFYKYITKILNGCFRVFAAAMLSFNQYILES